MPVKRITLLLDVDLVENAAKALGTREATDTVHKALERAVRHAHLRNLVAWELPDSAADEQDRQRSQRVRGPG